jgi:hypothetical protein
MVERDDRGRWWRRRVRSWGQLGVQRQPSLAIEGGRGRGR